MKTKFKTKTSIQFTTKDSTNIFNETIKVKFQSVIIQKNSVMINGFWYYTINNNSDRKIDNFSIQVNMAYFQQREYQAGRLDVIDVYKYIDKRLEQLFPEILDKDSSNIAKPNSTIKGSDLELILEESTSVRSFEEDPDEDI